VRKVTFGVGNSLDGYIARPDHGVDWLQWTKEVAEISATYWKTIDTVVMGRKTYEKSPREGFPGVKNYVFSRTLKPESRGAVELTATDPARFVARLKRQPGRGICVMGGGEFAAALFDAGLIDEVVLNTHPVLLGSGIPLFPRLKRQINLKLLEVKALKNGCVVLFYATGKRPANGRGKGH
jgi:dihydrofolate reductase